MRKTLKSTVELKECLKNPSPKLKVPVYTEDKDEDEPVHKPTKKKITLNQRMDQLEALIGDLRNEMRAGFKQVNSRIDKIEQRLDYNGLKPLPEENR